MRVSSVIAGFGLIIVFLVGLGTTGSAPWLSWLDLAGGVLCLIAATSVRDRGSSAASAIGLAVGLYVLWIVGMLTNGAPFQNWWTFVFACVMVIGGILGASGVGMHTGRAAAGTTTEERERFRKAG